MRKKWLLEFASLFFSLFMFSSFQVSAQTGILKGTIKDAETGETLIGASVLIQGTTRGTITDLDGNFALSSIEPGNYNIMISYVSYDKQLQTVEIKKDRETELNIKLQPATIDVQEVAIVRRRRTDTEMSVISSVKASDLIVSGISSRQISKTQDSDAAEVIRRVPGVTITDGRFVIVRGLIERYNSVLLNGATAPSFEADKRAFSFNAIPSGMIGNIMIYKSPAPELPADFAGAAIDVQTKSNADQNNLKVSCGMQYSENASFNSDYHRYEGGKLDWLGLDDGTRSMPDALPSTNEMNELYVWPDLEEYYTKTKEITEISRSFNTIWQPEAMTPFLDQNASVTLQRRFLLGKVSVGNISSVGYKHRNKYTEVARKEYHLYDAARDTMLMDFDFLDRQSARNVNVGLIHNWNFIYGKNQKIIFNNFLNNIGESSTALRTGDDYYDVETIKASNLKFINRLIYSGQLAGHHTLNKDRTKVNWLLGYSFTRNNRPDDRRLYFVKDQTTEEYYLELQNHPTNVKNGGRLYINLFERIMNSRIDIEHNFSPFANGGPWTAKAGMFYEYKYRDFDLRLLGAITPRRLTPFDFFQPAEDVLVKENFYFDYDNVRQAGLAYADGSKIKDSYTADNRLLAGYAAMKIPVLKKLTLYGGARFEDYDRLLTDFYKPIPGNDTLDITRDTLSVFPSVNITYNINEKHLIRFSYGKTVNRPEFREMSITDFEDFDLNLIVHGNSALRNAYVDNYDMRYEWYPNYGEMVSLAFFYKSFKDPIELFLIPSGTGYDYRPFNTEEATSRGMELDIRKTLVELEGVSFLDFLKNLTIVFNTSIIRSRINTEKGFAREKERIMQGQSPYIVNLGLFYNNREKGLMFNLGYNIIGERIAYAGTPENPHTWELPRNSLDLTLSKVFGKRYELRFGFKDILNEPVRLVQYYGDNENVEAETYRYTPNRRISFGLSVKLD